MWTTSILWKHLTSHAHIALDSEKVEFKFMWWLHKLAKIHLYCFYMDTVTMNPSILGLSQKWWGWFYLKKSHCYNFRMVPFRSNTLLEVVLPPLGTLLKSSSVRSFSASVTTVWMLSTVVKWCTCRWLIILGKKRKSFGNVWRIWGHGTTSVFLDVKNSLADNDWWRFIVMM